MHVLALISSKIGKELLWETQAASFTFINLSFQEVGHGVRAVSNERNLNFNGHGTKNEYNNNNGYNHHDGYSNKGYNRHNGYDRYGTENQHSLNLNALPIDPVTETAVK